MVEIIDFFFTKLTTLFTSNLATQATTLISWLTHLFMGGFSMYIGLLTFNIWRGGLDEGIGDITKRAMGWLIIIALGLNVDNYMSLANAIYSAPEEISGFIAGVQVNAGYFKTISNDLNKNIGIIYEALTDASLFDSIGYAIALFTTTTLGYAVIFFFLAMYLIAKFSLGLILIFGPIFIGFMLFPGTRQYGMNWIGQCANYVLTIALYSAALGIHRATFNLLQLEAPEPDFEQIMAYQNATLVVSVILIPVAFPIPGIASALLSGASISGGTKLSSESIVKKGLKSTTGMAGGVYNAAKSAYNRVSGGNFINKG